MGNGRYERDAPADDCRGAGEVRERMWPHPPATGLRVDERGAEVTVPMGRKPDMLASRSSAVRWVSRGIWLNTRLWVLLAAGQRQDHSCKYALQTSILDLRETKSRISGNRNQLHP